MKLTVVKDGKPVSADVVPSTAGTHRRFVLPDWARREMAWLDNRIAALEADKRALVEQRDRARRAEGAARETLMNVLGCEVVDVQIPAPDDGVRTFFTLDRNIAQPIFGVKPGDKILIARKPKS